MYEETFVNMSVSYIRPVDLFVAGSVLINDFYYLTVIMWFYLEKWSAI